LTTHPFAELINVHGPDVLRTSAWTGNGHPIWSHKFTATSLFIYVMTHVDVSGSVALQALLNMQQWATVPASIPTLRTAVPYLLRLTHQQQSKGAAQASVVSEVCINVSSI
jgi:hypothetical protein